MKSGIWNLGFGIVAVLAGASGRFSLPWTSTPTPLIVVGAVLAAFGLFQLATSRGR
jgi:tetrahydromethanopterin S-methyltransferase subunit C